MQCRLWFHSVLPVRGPRLKHYGYHLNIYFYICCTSTPQHSDDLCIITSSIVQFKTWSPSYLNKTAMKPLLRCELWKNLKESGSRTKHLPLFKGIYRYTGNIIGVNHMT